jgi:orotate phosphoribosyltransferase
MPTLPARIRHRARLSGRFVLRSGIVSETYFDKYQFEADPELLRDIALAMCRLVPEGTEVLAGLEMGGIPIVTMLSQVTGLPAAFIRKEPKEYGTCRYAEGTSLKDKAFILVEDVVSSGGALVDSLAKLKADGLVPTAAVCVIDRQTGGVETLEHYGLQLRALYTFEEIEQSGS